MTRLTQIAEKVVDLNADTPTPQNPEASQAMSLLLLALKSLSQRFMIALTNTVTLIGLGTAFWLWQETLPNPTALQLAGLALYAVFIVALRFVWR